MHKPCTHYENGEWHLWDISPVSWQADHCLTGPGWRGGAKESTKKEEHGNGVTPGLTGVWAILPYILLGFLQSLKNDMSIVGNSNGSNNAELYYNTQHECLLHSPPLCGRSTNKQGAL